MRSGAAATSRRFETAAAVLSPGRTDGRGARSRGTSGNTGSVNRRIPKRPATGVVRRLSSEPGFTVAGLPGRAVPTVPAQGPAPGSSRVLLRDRFEKLRMDQAGRTVQASALASVQSVLKSWILKSWPSYRAGKPMSLSATAMASADHLGEDAPGLFPQKVSDVAPRFQAERLVGHGFGLLDRNRPNQLLDFRNIVRRDAQLP